MIIDELVVELGLDTAKFSAGRRNAVQEQAALQSDLSKIEDRILATRRRTVAGATDADKSELRALNVLRDEKRKALTEATKGAKEEDARTRRTKENLSSVAREATAMFGVLAGANSIKNFVKNTVATDEAVNLLAHNLGMSTEAVSAWQGAAKQVGGTAQDANASLQSIVSTVQQLRLTGTSPAVPYLRLLGINSISDLQDTEGALVKISEAMSKMDPARAQALGAGMGLTPGFINLLEQGPTAVRRYLDAQREAGVIAAKDARAAAQLTRETELLNSAFTRLGRDILTDVAPPMVAVINATSGLIEKFPTATKAVLGFVGAFAGLKALEGTFKLVARLLGIDLGIKAAGAAAGVEAAGVGAAAEGGLFTGGALAGVAGGGVAAAGATGAIGVVSALAAPVAGAVALLAPTQANKGEDAILRRMRAKKATDKASTPNEAKALAYFISQGWSNQQAQAIVTNLKAESDLNPNPPGSNDGGQAYGVAQWHKDRQADFAQWSGHGIAGSSLEEQLAFVQHELTKGSRRKAGDALKMETDLGKATALVSSQYEGAGLGQEARTAEANRRAKVAQATYGAGVVNNIKSEVRIQQLTIETRATDAKGIAAGIGESLEKYNYIAQGNTGLN